MVGGSDGLGDVEGWGAEARDTEVKGVWASRLEAGKLEASGSEVSRSEFGRSEVSRSEIDKSWGGKSDASRSRADTSAVSALREKELDSPLSSLLPHSSASVIFNLIAQRA